MGPGHLHLPPGPEAFRGRLARYCRHRATIRRVGIHPTTREDHTVEVTMDPRNTAVLLLVDVATAGLRTGAVAVRRLKEDALMAEAPTAAATAHRHTARRQPVQADRPGVPAAPEGRVIPEGIVN
jgi:hypothetical protein